MFDGQSRRAEEATRTLDSMIAKGYSPSQELLNTVLHTCVAGRTMDKVSVPRQTFIVLSYGWDRSLFGCPLRRRSSGAEVEAWTRCSAQCSANFTVQNSSEAKENQCRVCRRLVLKLSLVLGRMDIVFCPPPSP